MTKYQHLLEARKDPDENARKWVAISISKSGVTFFLPQLVEMLFDQSKMVRVTVHEELKGVFNELLADKNRAKHEFNNGILADALGLMLKCRMRSARETAYTILQEILDEGSIARFIRKEYDGTKRRNSKMRIGRYLKRAMRDLNRSEIPPDLKDDLLKRAFKVKKIQPEQSPKMIKKSFVN